MSQIISEIRLFAFDFAPRGWLLCDGRPLMINSNPPLFSIIGTTFGGDGKTYFNLPDLRGKVLLGQGNGYAIGNSGGEEMHALTIAEMAAHNHGATASTNNANATTPTNNFWPADGGYETTSNGQLSPMALAQTGNNAAHPNMAPFLSLNYCIAVTGEFPTKDGLLDDDYAGAIKPFGCALTSRDWAPCDGRPLPISAYNTLYSIIGNKYGGDNRTFFNLPDLQGRAAVNWGQAAPGLSTYQVGDTGGAAAVTLTQGQLPAHSHTPTASGKGQFPNPSPTAVWANPEGRPAPAQFATDSGNAGNGVTMNAGAIGSNGNGSAHNNLMPYVVANYVISLKGDTPPRQ